MAFNGLSVLAVVPARGGSKGIPRKNLKEVGGTSLIGHAARVIKQLSWLDAALVSTDDAEIAQEAERQGLAVPFFRPKELAEDKAKSVGMWQHAWLSAEAHYRRRFDLSILLEPTSPLRQAADIELTVQSMLAGNFAAAATVSPSPAHGSPHKTLVMTPEKTIGFYLTDGARFSLRQDIPDYFHRNGICYAVRRDTLIERGHIIEENCAAVVIERPVVNIDTPFDLELAEWLLQRSHRS